MTKYNSEIFLGLVAPVGVDLDYICTLLKDYLNKYGYKTHLIKLSQLIQNIPKFNPKISKSSEYTRINTSMTAGNEIRQQTKQADILARYSIIKIQEIRKVPQPKQNQVYIFKSLKHPEEIQLLRTVYGKGFFLMGFSSSQTERLKYLVHQKNMSNANARKLINRDEEEKNAYGQHTRDAFYISDVFFDVDKKNWKEDVKKFFDLIFGYPYFTPTKDEFAMFLAFSASFRSGDLSRQVGAVITSGNGEIISTGCNDVPKKGGGLYWANDQNDKRDYQLGYDSNKEEQNKIADKILTELNMPKTEEAKLKLKKTGLFDITEYGRAVHAEMEALLACARIGVSSCGGTLYSTTFPCHNCAKHIVASGIKRVVFIEPYPKSKALELHGDAISFDTKYKQKATKVVFQPFIGVGPRRFIDLFSLQMSNGISVVRKKTDRKISWCERDAIFRFPLLGFSYLEKEISIGAEIKGGLRNG
ncbi:cytidine deaminase [bacterium]|nr:cytidine deaminase [bacterium]